MFAECLPKSVKVVVCLDRAPELVQSGGTIYREICCALMKENRLTNVKVTGGRYSYLGFEIQPRDVLAIYSTFYNKPIDTMPCEFVCGIVDDLRNKSLVPVEEPIVQSIEGKLLPSKVNQSILYGIGSDGTIGAARNAV